YTDNKVTVCLEVSLRAHKLLVLSDPKLGENCQAGCSVRGNLIREDNSCHLLVSRQNINPIGHCPSIAFMLPQSPFSNLVYAKK
ncbi:hypothetical protein HAX54_047968, partial [Datura stramonium]|nr:hypothetical protein [Datura stramonium]